MILVNNYGNVFQGVKLLHVRLYLHAVQPFILASTLTMNSSFNELIFNG